jgi:hypothetical protein
MWDWFDPTQDVIVINSSDTQAEEGNLCMQLIIEDIFHITKCIRNMFCDSEKTHSILWLPLMPYIFPSNGKNV